MYWGQKKMIGHIFKRGNNPNRTDRAGQSSRNYSLQCVCCVCVCWKGHTRVACGGGLTP